MKPPLKIACHECDLLIRMPPLRDKQRAVCPRCGYIISRNFANFLEQLLALALSAILFMVLALQFPFLIFTLHGYSKVLTLSASIQSIGDEQYVGIALLLYGTTVIIPLLFLLALCYVTLSLRGVRRLWPGTRLVLRAGLALLPWNMAEIFLVSVLVSMIKVMTLAHVSFGLSFFAYIGFIACLALVMLRLDKYQLWHRYAQKQAMTSRIANEY